MNTAQAQGIIEKLDTLKAANKAGKKDLLARYLDDPLFARFIRYALDTSKTFKVARVAETESIEGDVFEFLDQLNNQPAAKGRDKVFLAGLASQSPYHLDVVNRILRGRLDAGFDIKTVLEVAPDLVPYSPYCRCSGYDKIGKLNFENGVYSQVKADGQFINVHIDSLGFVTYTTRNGNVLDFLGVPDSRFSGLPENCVLMGEALVLDDCGVVMPRAEGNAIISKAIHGHISKEECARIRFELWDMVYDYEFRKGVSQTPYHQRFTDLSDALSGNAGAQVIETCLVSSEEEAWDHYEEVRERGLEGTILKDANAMWDDGTSPLQVKLKAEKEAEVLITGWKPGKLGGKYANCIGSLLVRSSCGKLIGAVSGMTDEDRHKDPESFIDRVATVRFNAVSKSAKTDIRSFDHCRLVELRADKNVADDLEYILNVKEASRRK